MNSLLNELMKNPLAISTLEVVAELCSILKMDELFYHQFIASCVKSCEETVDTFTQTRRVSLFCSFFKSLHERGILNLETYSVSLEPFCVAFSRVKEAAALFRFMKSDTN